MSTPNQVNETIREHYARSDLGNIILAALAKAGKDANRLTPEDLAPIDEFHIRGRAATLELARAANVDSTKRVLDVGSGVGGTSRCLAREFGCHVTGIDLTEEYCRAAAMLSARIGLAELVDYRQGDATNLPFPDHSFDIVWTEHVAMNIPDKPVPGAEPRGHARYLRHSRRALWSSPFSRSLGACSRIELSRNARRIARAARGKWVQSHSLVRYYRCRASLVRIAGRKNP